MTDNFLEKIYQHLQGTNLYFYYKKVEGGYIMVWFDDERDDITGDKSLVNIERERKSVGNGYIKDTGWKVEDLESFKFARRL